MGSTIGKNFKISIFGQSHSKAIGVTVDGLPAGIAVDTDELAAFMTRRAPGRNEFSTKRSEKDAPEFLSGLVNGRTCGAPLTAVIYNSDTRSGDYKNIADIPRPAHADFCAQMKYHGFQDVAGGGHFSGRLTAPLCIAGGIALQALRAEGIEIGAHISSIGKICGKRFDPVCVTAEELDAVRKKDFPVIDDEAGESMKELISLARNNLDSVGGTIECAVIGLPVGLGDPMFEGLENKISQAVFGIPAVKGIEFGRGFESAQLFGSENNDEFYMNGEEIKTRTNNHGGILGGISSGMPLIFRAAIKPTPSISQPQKSVSLSRREDAELVIKGRHDPCIVQRAVPCMEAAAAVAVYDAFLEHRKD
ncbi:MAG: chorismate synthase [Oscillospiraceae bacterium]